MGAAVTNFHLAGAAPQFAQGGKMTLQSSRCVAFGGFFGAFWKLLGEFLDASWGLFGARWGPLGGLLGPLGGVLDSLRALLGRLAPSEPVLGASLGRLGAI